MGYSCFDVSERERVAHVQLSRPDQLNTMIPDFWTELPEVIGEISSQGRARAIVISSTGRHFCAGLDLSVFGSENALTASEGEVGRRRSRLRDTVLHLQRSFSVLEEARMPVLVAVQGGCVGGAVDMVTAADCRYATADAWFSIHEINLGMIADVGTLQRLPKLVPDGIAREYAYTGRRMPAERAREIGLVNQIYPDHETMLTEVHAIAVEIASKSPLAVHGTKEMLNYGREHSVADGLNLVATWQAGMLQPTDVTEAFEAQVGGRDPEFEDLGEQGAGL